MIQMRTNLDVADNSGARRVQCIKVLGGSTPQVRRGRRRHRRLGQGSHPARPREEGRRAQAVDRAHRDGVRRADGSAIRFDRNAAVLINKQDEPIGTRIFGPVTRELRAQEVHEDHLARAGGALMAETQDQEGRRGRRSSPAAARARWATCCASCRPRAAWSCQGVNVIKRHTKPSRSRARAASSSSEAAIHVSNVALLDPTTTSRPGSASSSSKTAARCASRAPPAKRSTVRRTRHGRAPARALQQDRP